MPTKGVYEETIHVHRIKSHIYSDDNNSAEHHPNGEVVGGSAIVRNARTHKMFSAKN